MIDQELEERINFVTAILVGVLLLFMLLGSLYAMLFLEKPEEQRRHAFGCFESKSGGTIFLREEGALISDGEDTFRTDFELEYGRGYAILAGPLALVREDGAYRWIQPERDWGQMWFFDGPDGYFSRHATDLEKLDVLLVLSEGGGAEVRFVRSPDERCKVA